MRTAANVGLARDPQTPVQVQPLLSAREKKGVEENETSQLLRPHAIQIFLNSPMASWQSVDSTVHRGEDRNLLYYTSTVAPAISWLCRFV